MNNFYLCYRLKQGWATSLVGGPDLLKKNYFNKLTSSALADF